MRLHKLVDAQGQPCTNEKSQRDNDAGSRQGIVGVMEAGVGIEPAKSP
jgi:hypothetical protein